MKILLGYTGSYPIEITLDPIDVAPVIEALDEMARAGGDLTTDVRLSDGRVLWIRSRDLALVLARPSDDDPLAVHRVMDAIRDRACKRLYPDGSPPDPPAPGPSSQPRETAGAWPPWRARSDPSQVVK